MQRSLLLTSLPLFLASLALPAQRPAPAVVGAVAGSRLSAVLVDRASDGTVWVLAPGYKARFGPDGVDYIPYYGPKAARNHPVSFRLRGVERGGVPMVDATEVAPDVAGQRVTYERGAVREVWDLRAHEVEQTFVVAGGPQRGDLVVRMDVASDVSCADRADGLEFSHPGLGAVHFGDVVAFDDAGARLQAPSRWTGNGIELRLPATFADRSQGALTIDPVVRTISIDTGTDDNIEPDVAYEPNTDRWLVVYERVFSARDSDIISRRYNGDGGLIEEVAVATGTRESHRPSVAANAGARQFLIAWDEDTGISDRVILARGRVASSTSQGSTFTLRDTAGAGVEDRNPAVGGSIATDSEGNRYIVASEVWNGSTPSRMLVTRIRTDGTGVLLSGVGSATDQAIDPAITKARPTNGQWLLAYRSGGDVRAEALPGINASGVNQVVDNTGVDLGAPAVAGNGVDFAVVYSREVAIGDHNLRMARLHATASVLSVVANDDLTTREPGAVIRNDQKDPVVAFDGCRYTYAYLESTGIAGNYDAYAAVVGFDPAVTAPIFADSHRLLHQQTPNDLEGELAMASEGEMGGDAGRSFIAWQMELTSTNHDVVGCLFDGTVVAGGVTTVTTACGGAFSPEITVQNTPALGANLRLRALTIAPASQIFLIGLPTAPITLCTQGCKLGVFPILLSIPGASLDLPIPCAFNVIGARLAVQNVFAGGPLGCPASSFGVALNVSDTVVVQVQ